MSDPETVADYIALLQQFPADWRVIVATPAGGGIAVRHREIKGESIVAIFGKNGGQFGENPLTEEEYAKQSEAFMRDMSDPKRKYTSAHGDHRMYTPSLWSQASCYGTHYDSRVIDRMVADGLIKKSERKIHDIISEDHYTLIPKKDDKV